MSDTFELRCPRCNRHLGEVGDYARIPCPGCGTEVTVRSKAFRGVRPAGRETAILPMARPTPEIVSGS